MPANKGRVVCRTKGFYYLQTATGEEVECKVKGQLFQNSQFDNQIAVGDIVQYIKDPNNPVGLITKIDTRKSFLSRNRVGKEAEQVIAANVDYLFIVASTKQPPLRTNLINRMLVAATVGNIRPVLVITKTDLLETEKISQLIEPYQSLDLKIFLSSIENPKKITELEEMLSTSICLFSGQSGVGKTSLLNMYFPNLNLKIGKISSKTRKGSHTTTIAKMHQVAENGFVIDTPGIREFGLWHVDRSNLDQYYPQIHELRIDCEHRNCNHVHEPVCAVKKAIEDGTLHPTLYEGYVSIFNSLAR